MELILSLISLLSILLLIVLSCIFFTNAIEIAGEKLNLSKGAVGSLLAAIGTSLPETVVPLVAIFGAYINGSGLNISYKIGVGAILGAPFMLGTLAFFVTGISVVIFTKTGRRKPDMPINTIIMLRDLHYFAFAYFIATLCAFVHIPLIKYIIAVFLVILYGIYALRTVRRPCESSDECNNELDELIFVKYFNVLSRFYIFTLIFQLVLSLGGIVLLAHLFIEQLKFLSGFFHVNPFILSLVLTPIATELPEKFNSIIWIRAQKDTLALGNLTGSMVFQSCILSAIGITLTPWVLNKEAFVNIIIVFLSVGSVYMNIVLNRGILKYSALLGGGVFYLIYLIYVIAATIRS